MQYSNCLPNGTSLRKQSLLGTGSTPGQHDRLAAAQTTGSKLAQPFGRKTRPQHGVLTGLRRTFPEDSASGVMSCFGAASGTGGLRRALGTHRSSVQSCRSLVMLQSRENATRCCACIRRRYYS